MSQESFVGILSDTHSEIRRLGLFASMMAERGVRTLIHCGDITSPQAVDALRNFEVHWVFGNCDWEREALEAAMERCGHRCHGIHGEVEISGRVLAFTHGDFPGMLETLVAAPRVDLVIHGHTHEARDVHIRGKRVLCPGALSRAFPPTVVLLRLPTLKVEFLEIEDPELH